RDIHLFEMRMTVLARIGSLVFRFPFTFARSMSRLARLVGTTGRRIIECLNTIVIPKFSREKL
ncbi:MAG: hypothetical protein VX416_01515, partial [Pseudomonadota bacterium]|nr:hypothetical protein [Pseudomonadota bacterium]